MKQPSSRSSNSLARSVPPPTLLRLEFWKERLWPILFWGWALGITLWLELAPRGEFASVEVGEAFSNILFIDVRFEQLDEDNTRITLEAPRALMDHETSQLIFTQPRLSWQRSASDIVFHASGEIGAFEVQTDESDLPSEFQTLEISGNAQAVSGDFSVDAERLIFDNPLKMFYIPPGVAYEMRRGAMRGASPQQRSTGVYYDPIVRRMSSNIGSLLESRTAIQGLPEENDDA